MKTLTKGEQTRQHIVEIAAKLIYQQGFNHTGIAQILKSSGVSKGSFYFHFQDKDALGLEVIAYYSHHFQANLPHHLHNSRLSARGKIQAFHQFYLQILSDSAFSFGCPIGNLTQELTELCPLFSKKLNTSLNKMSDVFTQVIEQGIATQEFSPTIDAQQTAYFIVDSWEGALLRMKVSKNAEPLDRWYAFTQQLLTQ